MMLRVLVFFSSKIKDTADIPTIIFVRNLIPPILSHHSSAIKRKESKQNMSSAYVFPSSSAEQLECSPPTLAEVGGKAMSLWKASVYFPVPPGLVLSVAFFEPWLNQIKATKAWNVFLEKVNDVTADSDASSVEKDNCDEIMAECEKILSLSADQKAIVNESIKVAFGSEASIESFGVVAVRSSSPEEDLMGSSFAGGYETSLGVTSSTLEEAIVLSFASLFDHRIYLYKVQHGMSTDKPRIAIIIQKQIASDVAGVGFSINPSNNCYDEVMISANFGLGESVVGGTVTPDTYIVDRFDPKESKIVSKTISEKKTSVWLDESGSGSSGGTYIKNNDSPTDQALSDEKILEVADLIARVEEDQYDGYPVDTEWAVADNKIYLLQARPVTAYVPLFPEMMTSRGEEKRLYLDIMVLTQGFSDPLSILGLDIWKSILKQIKPTMSTEGREGLVWNINGRQYFNISNLTKMTGGQAMIDKAFRLHSRAVGRAFDSIDLKEYTPYDVPEGAKGILWKSLAQFLVMIPSCIHGLFRGGAAMKQYVKGSEDIIRQCHADSCSKDQTFEEAFDELVSQYKDIIPYIGGLTGALISRMMLHRMFSGCDEAQDLLISLCMDLHNNPTSEMGHLMVRLAAFPDIRETESSEEFLRNLKNGSCSKEFAVAYEEFLMKFGCRGIREIDAATPRTHEDQGRLFRTLKQIDVENNQIINVRERRDKAYQELLRMAMQRRFEKKFMHHADVVQTVLGYREHPKYMLVVMIDRMRRHALNIAQEFVDKGRLDSVDEIFWLTIDQITKAQKDPEMDLKSLVQNSKSPVEKVAHVKNWPVLIDSRGKIIRGVHEGGKKVEEGVLLGDPISPGVVKGRAKVLLSPYEKPLESGEILVARFTEPSWTPLFINAAGVVMEVGGPLQHGAVIAREYGIACVSGLEKATTLIKDGDILEVDGSAGVVKIINNESGGDKENNVSSSVDE